MLSADDSYTVGVPVLMLWYIMFGILNHGIECATCKTVFLVRGFVDSVMVAAFITVHDLS